MIIKTFHAYTLLLRFIFPLGFYNNLIHTYAHYTETQPDTSIKLLIIIIIIIFETEKFRTKMISLPWLKANSF